MCYWGTKGKNTNNNVLARDLDNFMLNWFIEWASIWSLTLLQVHIIMTIWPTKAFSSSNRCLSIRFTFKLWDLALIWWDAIRDHLGLCPFCVLLSLYWWCYSILYARIYAGFRLIMTVRRSPPSSPHHQNWHKQLSQVGKGLDDYLVSTGLETIIPAREKKRGNVGWTAQINARAIYSIQGQTPFTATIEHSCRLTTQWKLALDWIRHYFCRYYCIYP